MNNPLIITVSVIGGVLLLGGIAYASTNHKSKLDKYSDEQYDIYRKKYYEDEEYNKNLRERASYLRGKSIRNITQRRPTRRRQSLRDTENPFSGGTKRKFKK